MWHQGCNYGLLPGRSTRPAAALRLASTTAARGGVPRRRAAAAARHIAPVLFGAPDTAYNQMAAGSGVATHALSGGRSSSWDDGDGGGWRSGGRRAGGRSSSGADSKEIISMRARVEYIKTNRGDWGVIEVEVRVWRGARWRHQARPGEARLHGSLSADALSTDVLTLCVWHRPLHRSSRLPATRRTSLQGSCPSLRTANTSAPTGRCWLLTRAMSSR